MTTFDQHEVVEELKRQGLPRCLVCISMPKLDRAVIAFIPHESENGELTHVGCYACYQGVWQHANPGFIKLFRIQIQKGPVNDATRKYIMLIKPLEKPDVVMIQQDTTRQPGDCDRYKLFFKSEGKDGKWHRLIHVVANSEGGISGLTELNLCLNSETGYQKHVNAKSDFINEFNEFFLGLTTKEKQA